MDKGSEVEQLSQTLNKYGINVKEGGVVFAAIVLIGGLINNGTISKENMQTSIDALVQFYDNHPKIMSSVGLGIGILLVLDSINDVKEVSRFQEELDRTFKKYPQELWGERLTEIRRGVDALKTRQLTMGTLKFLTSIAFGYFAWASSAAMWLRGALAVGSGLAGAGVVLNGVNYSNLDILLKRLEQDGHLA